MVLKFQSYEVFVDFWHFLKFVSQASFMCSWLRKYCIYNPKMACLELFSTIYFISFLIISK